MSRDQALQRVADDVELAQGVTLFAFVNLYGCRIGKDTKIGTFVEIQKGLEHRGELQDLEPYLHL